MRRRMNLAGLLQYLLMLLLAGALVLLVMAGASPGIFALALLIGALLAALPAIYIGAILLPRQRRTLQRVRQDGLPACAEVLADGEQIASDFTRHAGAFKPLPFLIELPVQVLPAGDGSSFPAQLLAPISSAAQLKPGMWLGLRVDPQDPSQVVPAVSPDQPLITWTIRPVQEPDLPLVAALIRTAYAEQRSILDLPAEAFDETTESLRIRLEKAYGLLAEVGGEPVACIFCSLESGMEPGYGYLSRLAVLPEYRRLGIGRSLLAQAEQIARQAGLSQVRLGVRAEITRNLDYYQRQGYQIRESGNHHGYTKITYYIMQKTLNKTDSKGRGDL